MKVKYEDEKLKGSDGSLIVWGDKDGNPTNRQLTFGVYAAYWAKKKGWLPPTETVKYEAFKRQQKISKKKIEVSDIACVKEDFATIGATKTAKKYGVSRRTIYRIVNDEY